MESEEIEDILGQFYIAFAQGLGNLRVNREAVREIRSRYLPRLKSGVLTRSWETDGNQVLERVRAIGRLAAHKVASIGSTYVGREAVFESMIAVEVESATEHCVPY